MKNRFVAILLVSVLLLSGAFLGAGSSNAYARQKSSKTKAKSSAKKRSKGRTIRASAKRRGGSKWTARRVAARRRAAAYRRIALARARAVDQSLLHTVQKHILEDDPTGEDEEMRNVAIEALGSNPGTVVIMDPNNGHIYSIVNQQWAIGKPVKPCSTIKLITSIAALTEGIVDPDVPLEISGGADINMIDALARSNNEYFQELGEQLGFEQVINYAREWGLGELTGINMEGESPGYVPTYKAPRAVPRMCSHGDDIGITAVQLAVLTAAIANGGYIYQPQVLRTEEDVNNFKPILVRKVDIAEKDREKIIEGMLGAVTYGTAKRSAVATLNVAGKTGSCNGAESKLGLFASFSSPTNPELVVVVISTGSIQRGSLTSIMAGEIYSKLSHRFGKTERPRRVTPASEPIEPSQNSSNVNQ
ncbi:MAG: penicillin-binding transpeptidase domain-containing protein [Acidobacteriota bacterium]